MSTNRTMAIRRTSSKVLYPALSYQIVGAVYTVYNKLQYGYQEKYYQRAIAKEFEALGLPFRREFKVPLSYRSGVIGRYFIDFVVDGKVAIELKVAEDFYEKYVNQLLAYLRIAHLRLGILFIFTRRGLFFKRLVV